MTRVVLERLETGDHGTFGRIVTPCLTLFTGELPWRDNAPNISSIPTGIYKVSMTYSPRFKRLMYLLWNVKGRSGVRIHPANFVGDSKKGLKCQLNGCVALGEKLGTMDGQKAILVSRPAVDRFERELGGQPFELEVCNGFC